MPPHHMMELGGGRELGEKRVESESELAQYEFSARWQLVAGSSVASSVGPADVPVGAGAFYSPCKVQAS